MAVTAAKHLEGITYHLNVRTESDKTRGRFRLTGDKADLLVASERMQKVGWRAFWADSQETVLVAWRARRSQPKHDSIHARLFAPTPAAAFDNLDDDD